MKNLIIFIESLDADRMFIENEIRYFIPYFEKIYLIPKKGDNETDNSILENIVPVESYVIALEKKREDFLQLFSASISHQVINEVRSIPKNKISIENLLKTIWIYQAAEFTRKWLEEFCLQGGVDINNTTVYTFWYDHVTLAACLLKKENPGLRVCSRAHGYDLYEERHKGRYFPFREMSLKNLDRLFLISEHGKKYITGKYPWAEKKCTLARMGVSDPSFIAPASSDGILRVVSCSNLVAVKRVNLILEGLLYLTNLKSGQLIHWCHIGDGPLMREIQTALQSCPPNLCVELTGKLTNEEVLRYYRDHAVDVFINASKSEGLPVTIMEAQSCGIPVAAPAVGGIPEIVSYDNGVIMNADPASCEIAESIWEVYQDNLSTGRKRQLSRLSWQRHYDAGVNYEVFARLIASL